MADLDEVYGAPSAPIEASSSVGRLVGFLVQRLLRVGSAALVLVVLGEFVRPGGGAPQGVALALAGVALWTPTSVVLFRSRFLSPRGLDEEHPAVRATIARALTAEHLIGSLPLFVAALFAIRFLGVMGAMLGVVALLVVGRKLAQTLVTMERHVAGLEREQQLWSSSVARLTRLERLTWGGPRDAVRSDLAQSLQLMGRVDDAVDALERIASPTGHRVPQKLARLVVARDPARARALLASHEVSSFDRLVVEALASFHESHGELSEAQRGQLAQALAIAPPRQQGLLSLLRGADLARADAEEARRVLALGAWEPGDLEWLRPLWPAVADRLEGVFATS